MGTRFPPSPMYQIRLKTLMAVVAAVAVWASLLRLQTEWIGLSGPILVVLGLWNASVVLGGYIVLSGTIRRTNTLPPALVILSFFVLPILTLLVAVFLFS